jgi:hypothetical protein
MKKHLMVLFFLTCTGLISFAQKQDTVIIKADLVNTRWLQPGTNRYLVYFKMGKDSSRSRYQLWTRSVDYIQYEGKPAVSVSQEWESNDTVIHKVYSVCDRKSFAPLYQESWWKATGAASFDFLSKRAIVQNQPLSSADTAAARKRMLAGFTAATEQFVLNWHLDLEVFSLLPYKENTTFLINYYDPGFSAPQLVSYTVKGSGVLSGYDGQQVDCWLLEHTQSGNHEVFWISKKTREVLKLEQQYGDRHRYKVKLGFSV